MIRSLFFLVLLPSLSFAFDWQGHRGARGLYPENTIGAMEEALKYPVTTLELDVVISKDHKVVVSHEPWMSEEICLDAKGKEVDDRDENLYKMTLEEIQKFDCGSKTHPRFPKQKKAVEGKPELSKLFEVIEPLLKKLHRKISYNIEIKSTKEDEKEGFQPDIKTFSDLVVSEIKKHVSTDRFTIQSFDWRVLQYFRAQYPEIKLVALLEGGHMEPKDVFNKLGFHPHVFSPYYKDITKKDVDAYHAMKVKVIPWTVNDVAEMNEMIKMGVDGIITDYPDLIPSASTPCREGTHFFEGNCVTIPRHAVKSDKIPGWKCEEGFVQKRSRCKKLFVPKHAHLTEDGMSWVCNDGYKRYRSSCRK